MSDMLDKQLNIQSPPKFNNSLLDCFWLLVLDSERGD